MSAKSASWWSLEEIANDLDIPLASLYVMRSKGVGPIGHKIGKHVRVRHKDYEAWLASRAEARL